MSAVVSPEQRSPETTAYDASRYSSAVDWTKTCVLINGRPVTIASAEFQYFRVPDRERWRPILADIKGMGFNTVRLYIHWGYHSPAEGVYNFRGNRDIEYLLNICTELELFVVVAPGPYICAEVQAGGFPIWLLAKRELRVRHLAVTQIGMIKKWDQRWHDYCADYFRRIVRMLLPYERTTNPNGCIIALQVENELRQRGLIAFGGDDDEIRLLCEAAREVGSTVPLFHNDDSPIGSWSSGEEYRSVKKLGAKTGITAYRTDLYGFDLYFTFPPGDRSGDLSSLQIGMVEACGVSSCINMCGVGGAGLGGSDTPGLSCLYDKGRKHAPPPPLGWSTANQMESSVDCLERKMEKFGGSARDAPNIVAEAQVGWINQWGRMRSYDDVYNFFGDQFSATLQFSLMSQGITFINHYIAYGGTNHGTVGDAEVYSSYDYSAFIREYGLLSGRGRKLRMAMLFARSFSDFGLSNSMLSQKSTRRSRAVASVKSTAKLAQVAVREAVQHERPPFEPPMEDAAPRTYAFLRNIKEDKLRFNLIVDNLVLPARLGKCESLIAPLYHGLGGNISIFACTVPVVCRTEYYGSELWVLRVRPSEVGRLVLTIDGKQRGGRQGVLAKWASFDPASEHPSGELFATDQDPGAATSLLSAPLEELPLAGQDSLASAGNPLGLKTSTEEVGLCFSVSFASKESCIVSLRDVSEDGSLKPFLRLICLTEKDANSFSADLNGNDAYKSGSTMKPFCAAWGVSNLSFLPNGSLNIGFGVQDEGAILYAVKEGKDGRTPEQFQPGPAAAVELLPGLFFHQVPANALPVSATQGVDWGNPLSRDFELPIENWMARSVSWSDDVLWRRISYEQRDPLDHCMTSGHVAYRLRFRSRSQRGSIVINARHSAVMWCNGKTVGDQICYSHNLASAGAMHGIDLHHAGKVRHDLSDVMQHGPDANGFHEVIILVLSMGQSRSPFLLNDARNKRGLLSARLSRSTRVSDVSWEIAGVDVTRTDDAYGTSGLPLEDEAISSNVDSDFMASRGPELKADAGVTYFRGTFKVPVNSVDGGTLRYPLRLKLLSGAKVRVMIWVNTLFMGRYVESLGPQNDFYVPEGLIKQSSQNVVVIAAYGPVDTNLSVRMLPWVVDADSGNLDERNGQVYALRMANFAMGGEK